MKYKKSIILTILLALDGNCASLSLEDAIDKTLKTHPDMQIANLNQQSTMLDSKSTLSTLRPKIDFNANYYPTKTLVMPSAGTFATRQSDALHADITGSYVIWDAGRSSNRYDASLLKNREADSNLDEAKSTLVEQVIARYYTLAYLKYQIISAEQSVKFYEAQYSRAVNMRKSGLRTEADESRFFASLSEAKDRLASVHAETQKAKLSLELLVGSDEALDVEKEELEKFLSTIKVVKNADTLRGQLSENNPRLKSLKAVIEQTKLNSNASDKEGYGTISLVASYGYDDSISSYDSSQVGVVGVIPIYDGGKLSSQAQKSRIGISSAQKEYESREKILWQELFGAYSDFSRFDETIVAKMSVINSTQKALDLITGRYAQGLATFVDVLESRSVLDNAQSELSAAKLQKVAAWAHMQRLLNQPQNSIVLVP
ncbi:TolC family protein [Sulfurimonas sp.]|uniref:TolC family protein n=1 Tax=Sulfurimonas sp. TaxID=2022749 RepID=UPI0025D7F604|nr:TolC family protein [Sulfurimonas sp.]